ncbi:hypothetical protein AB0M46_43145 [Dactylosporangium sp. NPDC051485]|uniref:Rv0361 family membrane protein n=1 Tax=Dactylosporangium sp. NPDC051485 TaxID=3154846 RepID=UPI00343DFD29
MSRTAKTILLIVIGVVVVCCGGGIAGFFFLVNSSTKAPKAAAGDFLTSLEAGNTQAAYKLLCGQAQKNYGPETFDAYVKKNQPTAHDMSFGGSYSNTNGTETASISATVTYKSGKSSHTFEMRKEGGAWKVCGDPY